MVAGNSSFSVELRARRLWISVGWALVLLIVYLSLTPSPIGLPVEYGDKISHVLAYLALMSWFANIYDSAIQRTGFAIGFVILSIALEFVQWWVGYRTLELNDMVASTIGVALGLVFAPPRMPNYLKLIEQFHRSHTM